LIVIAAGNPEVFQLYPYPTLSKPLPSSRVRVFEGVRATAANESSDRNEKGLVGSDATVQVSPVLR